MKGGGGPAISAVVIARNEGAELRRTVANLAATLPPSGEIVVVDDGSDDGSPATLSGIPGRIRVFRSAGAGVAGARNLGARRSKGEVLVFADAHIRVDEGWWQPMVNALDDPRVAAVAPAVRNLRASTGAAALAGHGLTFTGAAQEVKWLPKPARRRADVPIVPGCCLAMTRDTFEASGGWDDGLLQRGGVDNELSVRLWLLGYRLQVVREVEARHLFRRRSPFNVGWTEYLHNRLRLALSLLSAEAMGRSAAALSSRPEFGSALALALERGAAERRRAFISRQIKNDYWYFRKFGIEW